MNEYAKYTHTHPPSSIRKETQNNQNINKKAAKITTNCNKNETDHNLGCTCLMPSVDTHSPLTRPRNFASAARWRARHVKPKLISKEGLLRRSILLNLRSNLPRYINSIFLTVIRKNHVLSLCATASALSIQIPNCMNALWCRDLSSSNQEECDQRRKVESLVHGIIAEGTQRHQTLIKNTLKCVEVKAEVWRDGESGG